MQRRARLAPLDLREHRRADARADGQLAQRQAHRVAQGANPRTDGAGPVDDRRARSRCHTSVRYHVRPERRAAGSLGATVRPTSLTRPDVLVLAGGGTLGEAWMTGLLAGDRGRQRRRPRARPSRSSAPPPARSSPPGSRPAPALRRPRSIQLAVDAGTPEFRRSRRTGTWRRRVGRAPRTARRLEQTAGALLAPVDRAGAAPRAAPGRAAAQRRARDSCPTARARWPSSSSRSSATSARFDGRLRIVGVDRRSGRRVVFGAPGAPPASVARAVVASCSIPGYFRPIADRPAASTSTAASGA